MDSGSRVREGRTSWMSSGGSYAPCRLRTHDFFDDRLHHLRRDGLAAVPETYFSVYPEKKNAQKVYCFFDEIQVVPGWESFVERIMRTEDCEVCITGSSAGML